MPMSNPATGIVFNVKDILYLIVIIGGITSSYFVNRGNTERRVSVLETKMDKVVENQNDLDKKFDALSKDIYLMMGQNMIKQ